MSGLEARDSLDAIGTDRAQVLKLSDRRALASSSSLGGRLSSSRDTMKFLTVNDVTQIKVSVPYAPRSGEMGGDCGDSPAAARRCAMSTIRWPLMASAALSILSLVACNVATDQQNAATAEVQGGSQPAAVDQLAPVKMDVDTRFLTDEEREVVQNADPGGPS